MTQDLIIKDSPISGKGIFATRKFKAGEVVLDWSTCTDILTEEEVAALPEDQKKFVAHIEGTYYFFKSPANHMNHSCDPNTKAVGTTDVATRDITEGEEITCDYVEENVPDLQLECNCGSANCKRIIKGT